MRARTSTVETLRSQACYWQSWIFLTALHLDVFEIVGTAGKDVAAVARRLGGASESWQIFLDALCAVGFLRRRGNIYRTAGFAGRSRDRRAAIRWSATCDGLRRWSGLAEALTHGGRPDLQIPFASNRKEAERLLAALDLDAGEIAPHLLKKLPLKNCARFLDVGGGFGAYSIASCRAHPRLTATLIEHPKIAPLARRRIRAAGMAGRIRVLAADILTEPLPRNCDVALLSNVLHGQSARENRSLLAELHRSLRRGGRLIVRDIFMRADRTAPLWGALFSVALLLHSPRGRCYSLAEVLAWLREAGFSRERGPFRSSRLPFDPDSVLIARAQGRGGARRQLFTRKQTE